jgi:hypothetical protein
MKPIRMIFLGLVALSLNACTADDVLYCRSMGVEGTSEQGNCMQYYHAQQGAFDADRSICAREADETYPPHLYDYGGYAHTTIGSGWGGPFGGPRGGFYGGQAIRIEPDFQRNAELDRLRMRIIAPCMRARGWVSGTSWQDGRLPVQPRKQPRVSKPQASEQLPWLR